VVRSVQCCPACGYPQYGVAVCFACRPSIALIDRTAEPMVSVRESAMSSNDELQKVVAV
jgi:hypothetical protein